MTAKRYTKSMPYFKDCFSGHQINKLSKTTERVNIGSENYGPQDLIPNSALWLNLKVLS